MASLMGKLFNYEKLGKGVSKASNDKKYSVSNFFRIYKEKFFKLIGLNLIYCVVLIAVLAMVYVPLNNVLGDKSPLVNNMEQSGFSSVYISTVERMISAYNIQQDELNDAWVEIKPAVDIIKEVNEAAISKNIINGNLEGFDSTKYTDEQLNKIGAAVISGFKKLGFNIVITNESNVYYYDLQDGKNNSVAKLTYVNHADKSDTITVQHSFPVNVKNYALILLCFIPLILLGPINLCMTRITRDYIRQEPSFMFSDMWDTFKKNWWQSFVIGIIQFFSITCAALAMIWYYSFIGGGFFFIIGFAACLFMTYMFVSMHFYVPLMQVTLNLNLRKIYKNALYFTIIGMFKNMFLIIIGIILAIAIAVLFIFGVSSEAGTIVISLTVTFMLICLFSLWFYLVSCFAYPSIQKYVIDPYYAEQNKAVAEDNQEKDQCETQELIANSDSQEGDTNELPEYVYHNGRMVHRSVVEQESVFEDDIKN